MIKTLIIAFTLLMLTACGSKQPVGKETVDKDPLNLFNGKPAVTVEGGTKGDPLDLFTDEEEKTLLDKKPK